MLVAVLDDTGTHPEAKYSSCIGIVAGVRQWDRFAREWGKRLTEYGVTDFHAHRFYARDKGGRVGQFRGWDDIKAQKFIDSMLYLFNLMKATVIGATVNNEDFYNLSEAERMFLTGQMVHNQTGEGFGTGAPNTPFLLAFAGAVNQAINYSKNKSRLGIVLDQNEKHAVQAAITWYQICALERYPETLVQGLLTPSRNEFNPLHLADLVAYLWNRYLTKGRLTKEQALTMHRLTAKGASILDLSAKHFSLMKEKNQKFFSLLTHRKAKPRA